MNLNKPDGSSLTAVVVGCGRMGADFGRGAVEDLPPGWFPRNHAAAIQSTPGVELIGLCEPDPERLRATANHFGIKACFSDALSMFQELKPDIVTVATRTPERANIIRLAAENGVRGIHTEKPFARNITELESTLAIVEQHGVKLTYGTTRRFMDVYQKARELIESGTIGTLQHICIEYGRNLLLWCHPHSVDLMLMYGGCHEVEYVQASCEIDLNAVNDQIVDQDPVVENAVVKFANGVIGSITLTKGHNVRLTGSDGMITVASNGTKIEIQRRRAPSDTYFLDVEDLIVAPEFSGTERAIRELCGAITGGPAPSISPVDIDCGQRILLAIARSSVSGGTRLSLSEIEDDFTVTGRFGEFHA